MFKLISNRATTHSARHVEKSFLNLQKEFSLRNNLQVNGKLVKILLLDKHQPLDISRTKLYQDIILPNKNCLFLGTTPTVNFKKDSKDTYLQSIYPGHNFSFITDEEGEVFSSISKRPDTNKPLGFQKRIDDQRLEGMPSQIRLYAPRYTTVQEDLLKWLERAFVVSSYPLYLHIFPLIGLGIDVGEYQRNVKTLLETKTPYSLCSWVHPDSASRIIRASNCNSDVQKAIFGIDIHEVQDMFCQEAAIKMASEFATAQEYGLAVDALGLNHGIEKSLLSSESYLPPFLA
ncbi:hypothetical protein [Legionella cardiaca]|uniref:Uncharacterized protein n=1 Tax=Legionella cardiaca TaxID=1071983 RepID=A0ABY8ASM6_9GAMM|nr:hypothetical protein [Legionella cardiaca]WED43469.1 hypothetical protein PXX05_01465 [Legionella cardiaca]